MDKYQIIIGTVSLLTASSVLNFVQFLITRSDNNKKDKITTDSNQNNKILELEGLIKYVMQGNLRIQLLVLIKLCEERSEEIIKVAKKYFVDFNGDWYMTSIFKAYLDENKLVYPKWFDYSHKSIEE